MPAPASNGCWLASSSWKVSAPGLPDAVACGADAGRCAPSIRRRLTRRSPGNLETGSAAAFPGPRGRRSDLAGLDDVPDSMNWLRHFATDICETSARLERMFEDVVARSRKGHGGHVPDEFDGALERLLTDAEADLDVVREWLPPEWDNTPPDEPALAYGTCAPSGWLALDLDSATTDPARLSDDTLIEAMIGFDRLASWAAARQARLLAELARRRPTDRAPYSARWAGVGSEYAPDEVGVALHLARGTACARVGLACRLLATLRETHALWETGQIDTAKARAIDDATWMLTSERARAVQARILDKAPEQTLAQLKAALARAVIAADPDGAEQRHRQARRDRRVVITPETDGMASLWALLTATQAAGAFTWLTRLARGLGTDDPRNMDTRRADILAALLSGQLVTDTTRHRHRHRHRCRRGSGRWRITGPHRRRHRRHRRGGRSGPSDPAGEPGQTADPGRHPLLHPDRGRRPARRTRRPRPHPRLPRPRDRRGRGVAPAGHRPPLRHPARPRPHHLPPTRRARRPHPSPRRPLQVRRLPSQSRRRRVGSHHRLVRRRHHQRTQPRRVLHHSPPAEDPCRWLARPRPPRRTADLDHPDRTPAHHRAPRLPTRPGARTADACTRRRAPATASPRRSDPDPPPFSDRPGSAIAVPNSRCALHRLHPGCNCSATRWSQPPRKPQIDTTSSTRGDER